MTLRLAIPNKGRLSERSIEILKQAGLEIENGDERRLYANVKRQDLAVMFLRAQDIVKFVHKGAVDVGITGYDLVLESGLDVVVPYRLNFGRCRLSVAVPDSMNVKRPEDLPDDLVVATSFPNLTKQYFEKLGKRVEITSIAGAAEIAPILGVADIIVDLVSSGSTLKMNHLRELAVIAESRRRWSSPTVRRTRDVSSRCRRSSAPCSASPRPRTRSISWPTSPNRRWKRSRRPSRGSPGRPS